MRKVWLSKALAQEGKGMHAPLSDDQLTKLTEPQLFKLKLYAKKYDELLKIYEQAFDNDFGFSLNVEPFFNNDVLVDRLKLVKVADHDSDSQLATWLFYVSIRARNSKGKLIEKRLPISTFYSGGTPSLPSVRYRLQQFPVINSLFTNLFRANRFRPVTTADVLAFFHQEALNLEAEGSKYLNTLKQYAQTFTDMMGDYCVEIATKSKLAARYQQGGNQVDIVSAVFDEYLDKVGFLGALLHVLGCNKGGMSGEEFANFIVMVKNCTMFFSKQQNHAQYFTKSFYAQNNHEVTLERINQGLRTAATYQDLDPDNPANLIGLITKAANLSKEYFKRNIRSEINGQTSYIEELVDSKTALIEMSPLAQAHLKQMNSLRKGELPLHVNDEEVDDDQFVLPAFMNNLLGKTQEKSELTTDWALT